MDYSGAAIDKPAMLVHASPRSAISRSALAEILRTMSFDLLPPATSWRSR